MADEQLGQFWQHFSGNGTLYEKQLLTDFLFRNVESSLDYTGRDRFNLPLGVHISDTDWLRSTGHVRPTPGQFRLPTKETNEVLLFF